MKRRGKLSTKSVQPKGGKNKKQPVSIKSVDRTQEKSILNLWDEAKVYPLQSAAAVHPKAPSDIARQNSQVDDAQTEEKPVTYVIREMPSPPNPLTHRTLCRKISQDIFLKAHLLQAHEVTYIPAWEKYPPRIEYDVVRKPTSTAKSTLDMSHFRKQCYVHYTQQLEAQQERLKQLGCFAAWDVALKTHEARQEAKLIPLISRLREYHYLQDRPHLGSWCPKCSTPLDAGKTENCLTHTLPAYVKFPFIIGLEEFGVDVSFCIEIAHIWEIVGTTELGISENVTFSLTRFQGEYLLFAEPQMRILQSLLAKEGDALEILKELHSSQLAGCTVSHPLFPSKALDIVLIPENVVEIASKILKENGYGEYAQENGEFGGAIHLNAAHNPLSYYIAQALERRCTSIFDETGKFTEEGDTLCGLNLYDAEKFIVPELERFGYLIKFGSDASFENKNTFAGMQRLHCRRCQTLAVFRPGAIWVFSLSKNDSRMKLINAPEYWENYVEITSNVLEDMQKAAANFSELPVSAQQQWGMPLPILFCDSCDEPLTDKRTLLAIRNSMRRGPESWFRLTVEELLPADTFCPRCNSKEFRKEATLIDRHFVNLLQVINHSDFKKTSGGPFSVVFGPQVGFSKWLSEVSVISAALSRSQSVKESHPFKQLMLKTLPALKNKPGRSFNMKDTFIGQYPSDVSRLIAITPKITRPELEQFAQKYLSQYERLRNLFRKISTIYRDSDSPPQTFGAEKPLAVRNMLKSGSDFLPGLEAKHDELALAAATARLQKVEEAYQNDNYYQAWYLLINFCEVDLRFYTHFVAAATDETFHAAHRTLYTIGLLLLQRLAPLTPFLAEQFYGKFSEFLSPRHTLEDTENLMLVSEASTYPKSIFQTNWEHLNPVTHEAEAEWESLKNAYS